ncbi:MAG: hypothetical protein EBX52_07270, partial [Proteobacteria bacterium]|nr:hypothetical protein [Pseudomonadota bacterium]
MLAGAVLSLGVFFDSEAQQGAGVPTFNPAQMAMGDLTSKVNAALAVCYDAYQKKMLEAKVDKDALSNSISGSLTSLKGTRGADRNARKDARNQSVKDLIKGGKSSKSAGSCYPSDADLAADKSGPDFSCDLTCEAPKISRKPTCSTYFGPTPGYYDPKRAAEGQVKLMNDAKRLEIYLGFKSRQISECDQKKLDAMNAEVELYTCEENALKASVGEVKNQIQAIMTANENNVKGYDQQIAGVGQQLQQLGEILGGEKDPNAPAGAAEPRFGGLLGMQKALDDASKAWMDMEKGGAGAQGGDGRSKGGWTSRLKTLKKMPSIAKAKLERRRMDAVKACMSPTAGAGSGGGGFLCRAEEKDATGKVIKSYDKPCGAMEHLLTKIKQAAYRRGGGAILRDGTSAANATLLDNMFKQVQDELSGRFETDPAGGAPGAGGAGTTSLAPKYTTWAELSSGAQGSINALQNKLNQVGMGYDFKGELEKVQKNCFAQGDNVRTQEMKDGSDSQYQQDMDKYADEKTALSGEIQKGLDDVSQNYSKAVAVLTGNELDVSLNQFNCTQDSPEHQLDCFNKVRNAVKDLKTGANGAGKVSRVIQGVPVNPPFSVPGMKVDCVGIDRCVTKFLKAREDGKKLYTLAGNTRASFVNQANKTVRDSLTLYSQFLGQLQQGVDAQYSKVAGMMTSMGAKDVKSALEHVKESEALKPGECGNPNEGKGMCPSLFGQPQDMNKVLSGLAGPQGLLDFNDTGLNKNLADAKQSIEDKKSKDKDALKSFDDVQDRLADLQDKCVKDNTPDNVKNASGSCAAVLKNCSDAKSIKPDGTNTSLEDESLYKLISELSNNKLPVAWDGKDPSRDPNKDAKKYYDDVLKGLTSLNGKSCDDDAIESCRDMANSKQTQFGDKETD